MDAPIGQHSDYPLGQLVELVNQPPNYGRSLDGTLARVAWVPRPTQWAGLVMVELYRRHRRTRKPLALRMSLMAVGRLRLITQPTADQLRLLEEVEPLRQEQASRRQQLKADRLAWEDRILSMAKNPLKKATTPSAIEAAQQPSPPTAPRPKHIGLAMRGVADLELLLVQQPPQGTSADDVTSFFSRQRSTLIDALAALLAEFKGDPSKAEPLQITAQLQADLASLVEEGFEFALDVQSSGEHTFVVTPDFDGFYVSLGHAGEVRRLASTELADLLAFIPAVWPHVAGAQVLVVTDDLAQTEACPCKLHTSSRGPRGNHEA